MSDTTVAWQMVRKQADTRAVTCRIICGIMYLRPTCIRPLLLLAGKSFHSSLSIYLSLFLSPLDRQIPCCKISLFILLLLVFHCLIRFLSRRRCFSFRACATYGYNHRMRRSGYTARSHTCWFSFRIQLYIIGNI